MSVPRRGAEEVNDRGRRREKKRGRERRGEAREGVLAVPYNSPLSPPPSS